jgi:sec-independent protein translocase protein TatB
MFNIGWAECLVILAVAVFVIGPKDLPKLMYQVGRLARRVQYIKYAFSKQFDDIMNEVDLDDLRHNRGTVPDTDESAFDDLMTPLEDKKPDVKEDTP